MPDFLSIPGNIRQQYMPFTIEGPGQRQLFSFKPKRLEKKPCPTAIVHPFSKHFSTLLGSDSSIQYTHGPDGHSKVEYEDFLDLIPAIQIREYMPDAKLTQTFKWFSYFKKGFDAGLQNIDSKSFNLENIKSTMETVMKNIGDTMKELTSGSAPKLREVVGGLAYMYQDMGYNIGEDNGFAVLFLPFLLYYRLTTTHTNNIYEIPYSMQNEIMKSDGTYGWSGSNQSDFGLVDAGIKKVGENPIARLLLGNTIKVNMMPSFQPTGEAHGESFSITIDLVNDSAEAAINNFLMCHTLFGNNRWLQYGFVQAGASLYDIKLPGANRYFMCSGQFSCKGKGAFRTPHDEICQAIADSAHPKTTFKDYLGTKENSDLKQKMIDASTNNKVKAIGENGSQAIEVTGLSKRSNNTIEQQYQQRAISDLKTKQASVDTTTIGDATTPGNSLNNTSSTTNETITQQAERYKQTTENLKQAQTKVNDLNNEKSQLTVAQDNINVAKNDLNSAEQRWREVYDNPKSTDADKAAVDKMVADASNAVNDAETKFSKLGGEEKISEIDSELETANKKRGAVSSSLSMSVYS